MPNYKQIFRIWMIKARNHAARSKSTKPRVSQPKIRSKATTRDLDGCPQLETMQNNGLGKKVSEETSTESEQHPQAKTGYQSRLRVRQPVRKFSYDAAAESDYGDSEQEGYLGKRRKGGKKKGKIGSRFPKFNDSNFSRVEKVLDWRRHYVAPYLIDDAYKEYKIANIAKQNLDNFGKDIQALFINIDWNQKTIKDLSNLNISPNLLKNGIVFIWSHKDYIAEILEIMATKKFKYIENICITKISGQGLRPGFKTMRTGDPLVDKAVYMDALAEVTSQPDESFLYDCKNKYFRNCKLILLMFHRNLGSKENLELRHQRNPDAFFDLFLDEDEDLDDIGYERIYGTIETLLPKALSTDTNNLKLMELYTRPDKNRTGWIAVSETD